MSRGTRSTVAPLPADARPPADPNPGPGPETVRLLALARASLPGGGIWTFSHRPSGFGTILDRPGFLIERADGAYAWTTDGERMLDMVLGSGSVLVGHAHPEVVAAVTRQIARGSNYSHLNPPAVELAARLVEVLPGAQRVRFFNSGSEAWVVALRTVRARTGRNRLLKFDGAFHGGNDATLFNTNFGDASTWAEAPVATPDSPGLSPTLADDLLIAPYDDLEAARAIARRHRHELAGILVEPVMRGISARPGFLEGLRDLADELHVPLVFDEVITGFRLALGGAGAFYGVTPDLAVYGKGLASGFPIGVLAGSEEAMAPLDPGSPDGRRVVAEGSTLGNPISATAALASVDILSREGTYEHLHRIGESIGEGLRDAFARRGTTIQLTGVGPIIEFYVSPEPVRDYRSAMRTEMRLKGVLAGGLPRHGVLAGGGRYNVSLAHGDVERDLFLETVETVLDETP